MPKSRARVLQDNLMKRTEVLRARALYIATSPWRIFKALCFIVGLVVILLTSGVGLYVQHFLSNLPRGAALDFSHLKQLGAQTVQRRLEDKSRYRTYKWVEIGDVSRDFLYTIVMSEDGTFFEHEGVDIEAIVNSMADNLKKHRYASGASTISQQVVKNLFLTVEKSVVRKVKEVVITDRIEDRLTKNQILELYLNIAEFGPDMFGIDEAARAYFGKKPSAINAAEGAFIALMLPSPRKHYYSIFQNKNLAPSKRRKIRRVLGDMLANELISSTQYYQFVSYDFFGKRGKRRK